MVRLGLPPNPKVLSEVARNTSFHVMDVKAIVRLIGGGRLMAVVTVKTLSRSRGRREEMAECVWCSHGNIQRRKFPVKSLELASTPLVRPKFPTRYSE